ncbi:MAG: hypothetical protein JSW66_07110 [Phycisphaerales bacterium]|nr:MAG: hypothetical protein JSW66_07110 [Phycisphaerales bacterium]
MGETNDDRFGLISGANHKFDNEYVLYVALSPEEIKRHYSLVLEGMSYCER